MPLPGKHLPTSGCEQGEMLELTPPVPREHSIGRRMARVFIFFLKSWLEKNFACLKKKKIKFGRSRRNKSAFLISLFFFFFACISINWTDIVGVKKCIITTELEQLFSVFCCWCMKPVVLANTPGKEEPKYSSAQPSSWQRSVIPLSPSSLFFFFKKIKVSRPTVMDSHTRIKWRELEHHANSCLCSLIG